jgi:hypothetical protein
MACARLVVTVSGGGAAVVDCAVGPLRCRWSSTTTAFDVIIFER